MYRSWPNMSYVSYKLMIGAPTEHLDAAGVGRDGVDGAEIGDSSAVSWLREG